MFFQFLHQENFVSSPSESLLMITATWLLESGRHTRCSTAPSRKSSEHHHHPWFISLIFSPFDHVNCFSTDIRPRPYPRRRLKSSMVPASSGWGRCHTWNPGHVLDGIGMPHLITSLLSEFHRLGILHSCEVFPTALISNRIEDFLFHLQLSLQLQASIVQIR